MFALKSSYKTVWRSYSLVKPGLLLLEPVPLFLLFIYYCFTVIVLNVVSARGCVWSWAELQKLRGVVALYQSWPACGHSLTIKSSVDANMAPFPVCSYRAISSDLVRIAILRTHYSKYYNTAAWLKSKSIFIVIAFIIMQSHNQIQNFGLWCYEVTGLSSHKLV